MVLVDVIDGVDAAADGLDEGGPAGMLRVERPSIGRRTSIVVTSNPVEGCVLEKGVAGTDAEKAAGFLRKGCLQLKERAV